MSSWARLRVARLQPTNPDVTIDPPEVSCAWQLWPRLSLDGSNILLMVHSRSPCSGFSWDTVQADLPTRGAAAICTLPDTFGIRAAALLGSEEKSASSGHTGRINPVAGVVINLGLLWLFSFYTLNCYKNVHTLPEWVADAQKLTLDLWAATVYY